MPSNSVRSLWGERRVPPRPAAWVQIPTAILKRGKAALPTGSASSKKSMCVFSSGREKCWLMLFLASLASSLKWLPEALRTCCSPRLQWSRAVVLHTNVSRATLFPQVTPAAMKVKIKCWNGVATWLWVANDENCGICRMAFNGCCPDCKVPGDDCPLVWGQCSHCFHMHCILKWLNAQQVQQHCPMCRQEWKFKE